MVAKGLKGIALGEHLPWLRRLKVGDWVAIVVDGKRVVGHVLNVMKTRVRIGYPTHGHGDTYSRNDGQRMSPPSRDLIIVPATVKEQARGRRQQLEHFVRVRANADLRRISDRDLTRALRALTPAKRRLGVP